MGLCSCCCGHMSGKPDFVLRLVDIATYICMCIKSVCGVSILENL